MAFIDLIMFLFVIVLYTIFITFQSKMKRVIFLKNINYLHPYCNRHITHRKRFNRCI